MLDTSSQSAPCTRNEMPNASSCKHTVLSYYTAYVSMPLLSLSLLPNSNFPHMSAHHHPSTCIVRILETTTGRRNLCCYFLSQQQQHFSEEEEERASRHPNSSIVAASVMMTMQQHVDEEWPESPQHKRTRKSVCV